MKESAWQAYRKSRKIRIELDDISLPGFWIEVLPTSACTPAETDAIEAIEDEEEKAKATMKAWIVDWNLPDGVVDEEGNEGVLPTPSESDAYREVMPVEITALIARKIVEADRERMEIPLESDGQ